MSKEIAFFPRLVKGLIKHNAEYLSQLAVALEKAFYGNKCFSRKRNISRCSWWNWLYVNEPMKSRIWERRFRVAISKWIAWELAAWWIKALGTASRAWWIFHSKYMSFTNRQSCSVERRTSKRIYLFSAFTTSWVERMETTQIECWMKRENFLVGIKQKCSFNAWILSSAFKQLSNYFGSSRRVWSLDSPKMRLIEFGDVND